MRKIDFTPPETEAWTQWVQACQTERAEGEAARARGEMRAVRDLYKAQKALYAAPDGPFSGLCAYCETDVTDNSRGEIEHYRPKAGVQDMDWTTVQRMTSQGLENHPGYYWLAYEWQNLLLSCTLCNQVATRREYGKGNRFPVVGDRAWVPGDEANEEAVLINPCIEDPAIHLSFLPESGLFEPITERGKTTIEICGLNLRSLPTKRAEAYANIEARFDMILGKYRGAERIAELRKLREDGRREFLSVTRQAYREMALSVLNDVGQAA